MANHHRQKQRSGVERSRHPDSLSARWIVTLERRLLDSREWVLIGWRSDSGVIRTHVSGMARCFGKWPDETPEVSVEGGKRARLGWVRSVALRNPSPRPPSPPHTVRGGPWDWCGRVSDNSPSMGGRAASARATGGGGAEMRGKWRIGVGDGRAWLRAWGAACGRHPPTPPATSLNSSRRSRGSTGSGRREFGCVGPPGRVQSRLTSPA